MKDKKQWQKAVISAFVLYAFLLNGFPIVKAQDIQSSDDISGGSSVFVFRKAGGGAQMKFAARNVAKRNVTERVKSRRKVQEQVSRLTPQRQKPKKVDPNTVANKNPNQGKNGKGGKKPPVDNTAKIQTSDMLAGAAETYLERNEVENAVDYFTQAIELNPKNQTAKLGLSEAYVRKGDALTDKSDTAGAVKFYTEAVKLNAQNAGAYAGLGGAYETLEQKDLALQNYEKALALNAQLTELYAPIGILHYQKGDVVRADDFLNKAVAAKAENTETQYFVGLVRYKQERNEESLAALKNAVLTDQNNAEAHYYLGEVYDRLDRDAEALEQYTRAVALKPDYAEAWFDLAVANYNNGRYEEAINAYNKVLRFQNSNAEAHANLADVYRQMALEYNKKGDFKMRQEAYAKAEGEYRLATTLMESKPMNVSDPLKTDDAQTKAEIYSKYGFILGRLAKWNNAIAALNKAVGFNPDAVDYINLGWAYYNAAKVDAGNKNEEQSKAKLALGKVALEKGLALSAANKTAQVGAFMNLGLTLADLGEYQAAVEAFKNCVAIREKWVPAYNELGLAYRGLNNLADAAKAFRKTTDLDEKFAVGWYNLGETEYQRGNMKEAKKAQDKLKKLNPGMANMLDAVFKGAVLRKTTDKLQEKNPLNKIPKLPY